MIELELATKLMAYLGKIESASPREVIVYFGILKTLELITEDGGDFTESFSKEDVIDEIVTMLQELEDGEFK